MRKTITTRSPEETIDIAASLAENLEGGDVIALVGDLGSGKTQFTKGLAKGLGVEDYLYVNSASFVVLKEYSGRKNLYHFDVYRLGEKDFRETIDYEKYFYSDGISVIEWADKISGVLPEEYLEIDIQYGGRDERLFSFRPIGKKYENITEKMN